MAEFDFVSSSEHLNKWTSFLSSHNFSETYLWQYWRSSSRSSELNKKFLSRYNKKILAQKELKLLIRQGVPPELRGVVWWACAGGQEKLQSAALDTNDSYERCLEKALGISNQATGDISRDLYRTFSAEFGTPDEVNVLPLKNVLLAYSVRNKTVGYCQSMNFMVALLLMYLTEEQTFWVLAVLLEDILPGDYYTSGMSDCIVDQGVFQSCLAWKLPILFSHLKAYEIDIEPITCSWFLSLYINILPLPDVLRIWDCLLWEGNIVLFRIGLTICKLLEREIFESYEFASVCQLLRNPQGSQFEPSSLMRTSYDKSWIGSIPRLKIEQLRFAHKESVLLEMSQRNHIRRMRALWAVKWSIAAPSKDSDLSLHSDGEDDDELTLDLSYQQEIISHETDSLLPFDSSALSLPTTSRNERYSTYEVAENFLQRVLSDDPEVAATESCSPLPSPTSQSSVIAETPVAMAAALEEEEDRSSTLCSPAQHRISVRMHRYLSESENCSPFSPEELSPNQP